MKHTIRVLTLFALVLLCAVLLPATKAEAAGSGTCGENLTWTLDGAGTLTISGTGNMTNYYYDDHSPWYNNTSIKTVVISDGVTSIGVYAFSDCSGLTSMTIRGSIVYISVYAFS